MKQTFFTTLAFTLALSAQAAPASEPRSAIASKNSYSAAGTCTFTTAADVLKSKKSCSTIILNAIAVPAGQTLDLTGLTTGTHVTFQGHTTFGYKEWAGPLVSVSGTGITVDAAAGAILDGDGARWWDGKGGNGGKTKPKFFFAHSLKQSTISNIYIKNSPVQVFSISGSTGLTMSGITVDNLDGDTKGGHNTDAFDVGTSSDITITGATVNNQDDCLAINSGTNIHFTKGFCSGGHGLSIGSVGGRSDNTVQGVVIESSTIQNSDNGVRIKTVSGATGIVSGITYQNIILKNIAKYGIVIEQDYQNGSPTGKPTTGVPITDLTLNNIKGTVTGEKIKVLCGKGSCSNWKWSGISIVGGKASGECLNVPAGATC